MEEKEGKSKFRVVDRRRFDTEGNTRAESVDQAQPEDPRSTTEAPRAALNAASQRPSQQNTPQQKAERQSTAQPTSTAQAMNPSQPAGPAQPSRPAVNQQTAASSDEIASQGEPGDDEEGMPFSSFVVSLATQALMQLGEMQPPPGVKISPDPRAAKQTIDILSMLEVKTRGNLDPQESQLMREVLHNLRIGYLRFA